MSAIEVILSASNLPPSSDPFAVLYFNDSIVGRTETRKNTPSPGFLKSFKFDATNEHDHRPVKIELYHEKHQENQELHHQKLIGTGVVPLSHLISQVKKTVDVPVNGEHGTVSVQIRTEFISQNADIAKIQFGAAEISTPDRSGAPNAFLVIKRAFEDGSFVPVVRTEIQNHSNNPVWEMLDVTVQRLCNGDYKRNLLFQVAHSDSNTQKLLGQATANLYDLLNSSIHTLNLRVGERFNGTLNVNFLQVANEPDYLGFAPGPCEISHLQGLRSLSKPLDQQSSYSAYNPTAQPTAPMALPMQQSAYSEQTQYAQAVPFDQGYPQKQASAQYPQAVAVPVNWMTKTVTQESDTPTKVTFINSFVAPVDISWVDYDGAEEVYNQIIPGEKYVQDTYAKHVWKLSSPGYGTLAYYAATPESSFVDILGVNRLGVGPKVINIVSGEAGPPIQLLFVNNTPHQIGIAWVDDTGDEVEYAQVQPRMSYLQDTYANHVWKAHYLGSNVPLVYYRGSAVSEQVDIRGHNSVVNTPLSAPSNPPQAQPVYPGYNQPGYGNPNYGNPGYGNPGQGYGNPGYGNPGYGNYPGKPGSGV
ncbi:hypothetical protein THRCLA_07185 [Thraustotheca clavata]|uniref:C2 domain-containing protein n=1 Tax=Thraustotheca clavata TaxID=74557 RepID=A0A1V9ZFF9_9STRA|nr:hypothetical protein THRCLA_07185 [Thraustotheca clavata]